MGFMELNIFTNCSIFAPSVEILKETYISFCQTFDPEQKIPVTVYCDKNPKHFVLSAYIKNLEKLFDNIEITNSLSEGYIKSIASGTSEYLFQIEHDWVFNNEYITHYLEEIIDFMRISKTYHFRFNKRSNKVSGWDKIMKPGKINGFNFCQSNNLSNNPHIIDREFYQKKLFKLIKVSPGSKGIEERLNMAGKYKSILYGPEGHPATVTHIDGRK
jgi:hypothetical protein